MHTTKHIPIQNIQRSKRRNTTNTKQLPKNKMNENQNYNKWIWIFTVIVSTLIISFVTVMIYLT